MMKWILQNLEVVIVILIFASQVLRALLKARRTEAKRETPGDLDAERRVREVQEEIRRQIASRRREAEAAEPPPLAHPSEARPPVPRPQTTQMPEPFGGPLGRMLEELQRRAQQPTSPPPPLVQKVNTAELERQQRLADELRAAEETRLLAQRRAAHLAAERAAEAESETALRTATHDRLLDDLRNPQNLRRAVVLREILGTPVGLR